MLMQPVQNVEFIVTLVNSITIQVCKKFRSAAREAPEVAAYSKALVDDLLCKEEEPRRPVGSSTSRTRINSITPKDRTPSNPFLTLEPLQNQTFHHT